MTCLRYPNSDPYYPGRVIHLEPSDDAWEMARAWSRRVDVIECDCVAHADSWANREEGSSWIDKL